MRFMLCLISDSSRKLPQYKLVPLRVWFWHPILCGKVDHYANSKTLSSKIKIFKKKLKEAWFGISPKEQKVASELAGRSLS